MCALAAKAIRRTVSARVSLPGARGRGVWKRVALVSLLLAPMGLGGCAKSYIAVHATSLLPSEPQGAEVKATPAYRAQLGALRSVSVRMPNRCLAANATGSADGRGGTSSAADCGVWASALERALAEKQLRVISWHALARLESSKGFSTYQAARELGAQAVVLVNDFSGHAVAGGGAGHELLFFRSDPEGKKGAPIKLNAAQQRVLGALSQQRLQAPAGSTGAMVASLDAAVVWASSGESVWFYRRRLQADLGAETPRAILFRGRDRWWRPVHPRGGPKPPPTGKLVTKKGPQRLDPGVAARRLDKARDSLVQDLVHHFLRGASRQAPPSGASPQPSWMGP